jgi:hypothetical protein
MISPKILHPGNPRCDLAATTIDPIANGRAKMVWEKRMKVRKRERGCMGTKPES